MSRAGKRRAFLQVFDSTETEGAGGDVQPSWASSPTLEIWSRKRTMTAGEQTVAAARQLSEDVVFEVIFNDLLTTEQRILQDGEYFDITSLRDPDGRGRELHIYASSGKRIGA